MGLARKKDYSSMGATEISERRQEEPVRCAINGSSFSGRDLVNQDTGEIDARNTFRNSTRLFSENKHVPAQQDGYLKNHSQSPSMKFEPLHKLS